MQTTSATWKQLWAAGAPLEARAAIAGTVYTEISAPVINRAAMQSRLSVGNVAAASLQISVRGGAAIPRSAEVVIEARLNDGATASEWLPQGTFYVSRRARDPVTGVVALECYDALLKANAVWTPSQGSWPRTMAAVAAELLALLGLELDSRTAIPSGAAFAMSEPAAGTTIRDALGTIAQAGGGSWIVTPAGKLRLVPIVDASNAEGAEEGVVDVEGVTGAMDAGAVGTITGVRCTAEGEVTLTGDDSGIVVDVCVAPAIAVEAASLLIGKRYQAYRLSGAVCDPAAELGDYVRAGANGEIASALYSQQIALGPACRSEIAAPEAGELSDEYPYIGSDAKALALAKAYADRAVGALDNGLDQQEIFDRLTDNGAAQGLVLYNGQLYVNASYIQAGTLTLGGLDNVNGRLRVLNAAGNEVGKWDNSGLEVKEGTFNAAAPGGYVAINAEVVPAIRRAFGVLWSPSTGDDVLISADRGQFSVMAGYFDGFLIDDGHTDITPGRIDILGTLTGVGGITINGTADYSGGISAESTALYENGRIRFTDNNDNIYFNLDYLTGMTIQGRVTAAGGFVGNVTGSCSGSAGSVAWGNVSGKPANYPGGCTGSAGSIATEGDNRNVNTSPNDYQNKLIFRGLKKNTAINSPSSSVYSYLIGLRGWSDSSGGNSHELAFNDTGIFHRSGGSSWNGWKQIPMGDGTGASGTWGISITGNAGTATKATQDGSGNTIASTYLKVTDTVAVGHGGTGATSAANARTNLGIYSGRTNVSFSNGVGTIAFSTIGISSRPSVFVAMLNTTSSTGMYLAYAYNNSSSSIQLRLYSGTSLVSGNSGPYAVSWICIA